VNVVPSLLATASIFDGVKEFADDAAAYGYWAIMLIVAGDGVFPVLPGETAIVAAAVLAADGALSLPLVILAGAVGAVIGDSTAFWIGRGGSGPLRRGIGRFAGPDRLLAAERMVRRQGPALVFTGRFLPGIRIAINLSCGAGQMSYPRFLLFDALGGLVWATQAALLG
jgi:membrane-associated protein